MKWRGSSPEMFWMACLGSGRRQCLRAKQGTARTCKLRSEIFLSELFLKSRSVARDLYSRKDCLGENSAQKIQPTRTSSRRYVSLSRFAGFGILEKRANLPLAPAPGRP